MNERHGVWVGDGMTVHIGSDAKACTVVAVSRKGSVIQLQRDEARRTNADRDVYYPGGFAGHMTHPEGQGWEYRRDTKGEIYTATWRESLKCYKLVNWRTKSPGGVVTQGRHEYYDYNF